MGKYSTLGDMKHTILRLPKRQSDTEPQCTLQETQFMLEFAVNIIGELIGPEYLVPMKLVKVTPDFLEKLITAIEPRRPIHRRSKTIDKSAVMALSAQDVTRTWHPQPTLTIEFKPKWGFKPQSNFIHPTNQQMKKATCRFCMHQPLKEPHQNPAYCPMDLYSMDRDRMVNALCNKSLILFLDGEPVENSDPRLHAIIQGGNIKQSIAGILTEILLKEPLLPRLKRLQQQLDELDIEGIYPIYKALVEMEHEHLLLSRDIEMWRSVMNRFRNRCTQPTDHALASDIDKQIQRVYEYTASMTLKDCSAMISITPCDGQGHPNSSSSKDGVPATHLHVKQVEHDSRFFAYDVKVVDVDPKNMSKIPQWFALDQRITENALKHNMQKHCSN